MPWTCPDPFPASLPNRMNRRMEAVMTLFRHSRWVSTFLVGVVALSWLVASNHCALAALENSQKAAHACCHERGKTDPQPQSAIQCCDTFHVTVPALVTAPETQLHALEPAWAEASPIAVAALLECRVAFSATGPPRALGFVELVLNRSLLSHAPPRFVA